MFGLCAEQLVFVDESSFRQDTGRRQTAWTPVGCEGRYNGDRIKGRSWSVLPAYTVNGYLPCTGFKEGYFTREQFARSIYDELLPHTTPFPGPRSVIIMDNVAFHTHSSVQEAIEEASCEVRFLPPYSPDFNPIELPS